MSPTSPPGDDATERTQLASERTHLANERTYLAWWRTGLGCLAVSIGTGRVVPALTRATRWPYVLVGTAFALLGIICTVYAYRRHRQVEEALARGEPVAPDRRLVAGLAAAGTALGVIVLAVVVLKD